jgi:NADH dehydrogenase/NADH:ubiquinone oxidoreductase subunit G
MDRSVEVPAGTLLHEAAGRAGIWELELPCGAQGECGECLVELVGGERVVIVPACQTKVRENLVVRLLPKSSSSTSRSTREDDDIDFDWP